MKRSSQARHDNATVEHHLPSVLVPILYLDTSVVGGYYDDEWKDATRELWAQRDAGHWRFATSVITFDEITQAPAEVSGLFQRTFTDPADMLMVTDEMEDLAAEYLAAKVVSPKFTDDARHVAVVSVLRLPHLVSWNFKHLVNVQREAGFNAVNLLQGYPPVRIVTPLQLIYGRATENL